MNIVNAGTRYQIYGEELHTFTKLPVGSYEVDFNKMTGFFLTSRADLLAKEEKIYGSVPAKVTKVLRSYQGTDRNFGVILSGMKGIGKSLFVRVLAQKAIENNIPVILVSTAIPGIETFIASIEQDVMIIFDEFEKVFAKQEDWVPQDDLLSLFDGMDGGHKLFVITCNDTNKISSYMLNRPGRFHYHFTLMNPSADEVREYMEDKLDPQYHDIIPRIVNVSQMIDMTYDFLRAIAYEINQGYSIEETMTDLNISRTSDTRFDIVVITSDGIEYHTYNYNINMSEHDMHWVWCYGPKNKSINIGFIPDKLHVENGQLTIPKEFVQKNIDEDDFDNIEDEVERKAMIEQARRADIISINFIKVSTSNFTRLVV